VEEEEEEERGEERGMHSQFTAGGVKMPDANHASGSTAEAAHLTEHVCQRRGEHTTADESDGSRELLGDVSHRRRGCSWVVGRRAQRVTLTTV
jgi:hypothetical protein